MLLDQPVVKELDRELDAIFEEVDELLEQTLDDSFQKRAFAERRLRTIYEDTSYFEGVRARIRDAYNSIEIDALFAYVASQYFNERPFNGKNLKNRTNVASGFIEELKERDIKCPECKGYHNAHAVCDDCGELLHIDSWYKCEVTSVVTRHTSKGHERVLHLNAKGAPDTLFYYNPKTKETYWPGHTERHIDPNLRIRNKAKYGHYVPVIIGVRDYGLKSRLYKFLDRLAIDRRWKRLEKEDAMFSPLMKENRARLARRLQTDFGKEMAYEAIKKSNSSSEMYESYAPGSHIEAWEWDEKNIRDGRSNDPLSSLEKKQLSPEVARANARKYKIEAETR